MPTTPGDLGRVVWVQESTSGWARVQALLGDAPPNRR